MKKANCLLFINNVMFAASGLCVTFDRHRFGAGCVIIFTAILVAGLYIAK